MLGLAVAGAFVKTSTGRGWVFSILARRIERDSGILVRIGSSRLSLLRGEVALHDVRIRAAERERPFVTAGEVEATFEWRALFTRPLHLTRVIVRDVVADTSMLPKPRGESKRDAGPLPLHVDDLRWETGEVGPWLGGERYAVWFDHVRVTRISGEGTLRDGILRVAESSGTLVVQHPDRPTIKADIDLAGSIGLDGTVRAATLTLLGEGWQGEANLTGTDPKNLMIDGWLDARLGRLFPDLTSTGQVHIEGRLGWAGTRFVGDGDASLSQLPARLLEPLMRGPLAEIELAGKQLEANGRYRLDLPLVRTGDAENDREILDLDFEFRLMRGREILLQAKLTADSNGDEAYPVHVTWDARLLPGEEDQCISRGSIRLRGWDRSDGAILDRVAATANFADVGAAAQRFGLLTKRVDALRPVGSLSLDLTASGPLETLRLDGRFEWVREGAPVLEASVETADLATGLEVHGTLLAAEPGRREWRAKLKPDPETGWAAARFDTAHASILLPDPYGAGEQIAAIHHALMPELPHPAWIDLLLTADPALGGNLALELDLTGPLTRPTIDADFAWQPGPDETLRVVARGTFPLADLERSELEHLEAEARNLNLTRLAALLPRELAVRVLRGTADASLQASGPLLEPRAELLFHGRAIEIEGAPAVERLTATFSLAPEAWALRDLAVTWEDPSFGVLQASAKAKPGVPIRELSANLVLYGLPGSGDRAEAELDFRDGILRLVSGRLTSEDGSQGTLTGVLPLSGALAIGSLATSAGRTVLHAVDLDVGAIVALWLDDEQAPEIACKLTGTIDVDLQHIAGARGQVRLDGFRFKLGEERVDAVGSIEFRYGDGGITLVPGRLLAASSAISGTAPLDVGGHARFNENWTLGAPLIDALRQVQASIDGNINASLIAPILGATGTGPVELHLRASGRPGDFSITGTMRGEKARFLISDPYPTRIANFDVRVSAQGGTIRIDRATADINGGSGHVEGVIAGTDGLDLNGRFEGVRYRLGFGVTTRLDADLRLRWPLTGRRQLAGTVVVDRAVLNRDLNLDREILRAIFDPELDTGTSRLLETVDLELTILTDQGLIIRNNLAELRADWSRLDVRGTLADPLLTGVAEVAAGGRFHLLGETLRIDEASLNWSSSPPGEPTITLQTTSSREDPTIGQAWRSGWYTTDLGPGKGGTLGFWGAAISSTESSLGTSLAIYTQDRLYGSLAQVLDRTELSYEPLPLFGETDTEARFTLSQDLTSNLSFIASNNPREAEGQTYILDLHNFYLAPRLRAQVFTGDNETRGATLQQTLILGNREHGQVGDDPVVRERILAIPNVARRRDIKRAVGFRKGDPFPAGAELDVEVDVAEVMRRSGYPDATVNVQTTETGKNKIDLAVSIEPGQRVGFVFDGPRELPRSVRSRIRGSYRSQEEEARSLNDMRSQAERALRAVGCLEPIVDVARVAPVPGENRRITITSACAREADLEAPVLLGLPDDVAEWVAGGFASPLSRIELAAGLLEADDYLLRMLDAVGYADAGIVARRVSADGRNLEVTLDPGPRRYVEDIRIEGADETTAARAKGLISIRKGDPLRRDWIAASARALEADLRDRGYAEAVVRRFVEERPDDPTRVGVLFKVTAGRPSEVQQVKIEGFEHSKPSWISSKAGLATGTVLRRDEIAEARGRLYRTGVFERIRVTTESLEDNGEEPADVTVPRPVAIAFELDEAPRYRLSYGGRWESDVGLSGVIDLVNRHSLGRGHRTGVRAILNDEVRSLRLYHLIPQPLRSERSSLELFVEAKRERIEDVRSDVVEAWAQLTFPLTDRMQTRVYMAVGKRHILSGIPSPDIPLEERVISPRFGWQLAYTTVRQGLINLRRKGFFFGLDISGSHASLGSTLTTLGVFTQFKVYAPFGPINTGRFSWHQSYRAGLLTAREQPIPFVDRLRAGGEFSVRGYPTNGIGPLIVDDTPLGGELLFVVNQELHARLWDSLFGVVFFDAGNVWISPADFKFELFRSVGIGARYTSAVGPLRFDIGFPLDRRSVEPKYQIYVGFGSVF